MKKIAVLITLASFALVLNSFAAINYVTVGETTYFSDDVKVGIANIKISTEDGSILKTPLENVNAYMVDGKLCERLPVICKDGSEKCTALMELVAFRNGLGLYKFSTNKCNEKLGCTFYDENKHGAMYLVYRNGELHLRVDNINANTVFPFFGVEFVNN
ncbi:MAG: hypothetical protein PHH93_02635 [Prolixibacteraceae bacterium]|nr:hypothetical protein [Prolixibacteraceae bacterium]